MSGIIGKEEVKAVFLNHNQLYAFIQAVEAYKEEGGLLDRVAAQLGLTEKEFTVDLIRGLQRMNEAWHNSPNWCNDPNCHFAEATEIVEKMEKNLKGNESGD